LRDNCLGELAAGLSRPGRAIARQFSAHLLRHFRAQRLDEIPDQVAGAESPYEAQRFILALRADGRVVAINLGSLASQAFHAGSEHYGTDSGCEQNPKISRSVAHGSFLPEPDELLWLSV
jgi:hypothetical protein